MNETYLSPFNTQTPKCFPKITKPDIIGCFAVDEHRNFQPDGLEKLKYLKLPPAPKLDLNQGYETVVHKLESAQTEKLDQILKFILENKPRLCNLNNSATGPSTCELGAERPLNYDFICFRGLLRLLMCSPYEMRDDFCVLATRYKGTIYLCQKETWKKRQARMQETEAQKKICSYGFKFEQYLLTDDPTKEPDTTTPVNENEEVCCVFKTNLAGMNIMYGAEMDGIISKEKIDLTKANLTELEFIELKVKLKEKSYKHQRNFSRFKLRNWWTQSFLVNINRIFVGIRNDKGFIDEIDEMNVKNMTKECKEFWSPAVCADFLEQFLQMIVKITKNTNCSQTVFEFYWDPSSHRNISYDVLNGTSKLTFLPEWYTSVI